MNLPPLDLSTWRLLLAVATFLAASHAWRKLSPYFCATWFGAGLLFGYLWTGGRGDPAVVLPPALLVYLAAAVTKGLIETRPALAGNHLVHVLVTALVGGLLALPFEATARVRDWPLPRAHTGSLWGIPADALGGVPLAAAVDWSIAAAVFYGTYKLLDHVGLKQGALQTVLLFGAMPFVVGAANALSAGL